MNITVLTNVVWELVVNLSPFVDPQINIGLRFVSVAMPTMTYIVNISAGKLFLTNVACFDCSNCVCRKYLSIFEHNAY